MAATPTCTTHRELAVRGEARGLDGGQAVAVLDHGRGESHRPRHFNRGQAVAYREKRGCVCQNKGVWRGRGKSKTTAQRIIAHCQCAPLLKASHVVQFEREGARWASPHRWIERSRAFCDPLAKQHFTTFSLRAQLRTLGSRKTHTLTHTENTKTDTKTQRR